MKKKRNGVKLRNELQKMDGEILSNRDEAKKLRAKVKDL